MTYTKSQNQDFVIIAENGDLLNPHYIYKYTVENNQTIANFINGSWAKISSKDVIKELKITMREFAKVIDFAEWKYINSSDVEHSLNNIEREIKKYE